MIKKIFAMVFAVLMSLVCLTACGKDNGAQNPEDAKYTVTIKETPASYGSVKIKGIDDDVMPIGGFIGPTANYSFNGYKYPSIITDAVYEKMAMAGVNLVFDMKHDYATIKEGSNQQKCLELAKKYGIQYIVMDTSLVNAQPEDPANIFVGDAAKMKERITAYQDYPISGWYVRDEPRQRVFNKLGEFYDVMHGVNAELNNAGYIGYTNLFPNIGGAGLAGEGMQPITYQQYIDYWAAEAPGFLMYDYYPMAGAGTLVGGNWFTFLQMYQTAAEKNNMPFWPYIQTFGKAPDAYSNRQPNESEFLWMINTSLAMGAKGYAFFPLCMPPEYLIWGVEDSRDIAIINEFGSANAYAYYAAKAAEQVRAIDHVLMKSAWMGLMSHENKDHYSPASVGDVNLLQKYRQLKSISGDTAVVGCFDYNGATALYVVNNSIVKGSGEVTLKFDGNYGYDIVQRGTSYFKTGKNLTLNVEAGESVLVVLR